MNSEEIKTLIRKLEAAGYEKVKENLRHNRYSSRKLTYINEWLEKQEGQTWLYHEFNGFHWGQIFNIDIFLAEVNSICQL